MSCVLLCEFFVFFPKNWIPSLTFNDAITSKKKPVLNRVIYNTKHIFQSYKLYKSYWNINTDYWNNDNKYIASLNNNEFLNNIKLLIHIYIKRIILVETISYLFLLYLTSINGSAFASKLGTTVHQLNEWVVKLG